MCLKLWVILQWKRRRCVYFRRILNINKQHQQPTDVVLLYILILIVIAKKEGVVDVFQIVQIVIVMYVQNCILVKIHVPKLLIIIIIIIIIIKKGQVYIFQIVDYFTI
jgi:hypothetical protein